MKKFIQFVKKEFIHVFRDRRTLLILFGMPVMQILIFGFALSNEIKNTDMLVIDKAHDYASSQLINKIDASKYFNVKAIYNDERRIEALFKSGKYKIAMVIPASFHSQLNALDENNLQLIADASDPNNANLLITYVSAIVRDFRIRDQHEIMPPQYTITPQVRMLYNPQLKSEHNFVPGVMALVLMLVCVMMTAVTIVKEKETGTMEVLLVSPLRPWLIMISKAFPYLILSLINVATIVLLSIFVLKLPVNGSILLLFAMSILFIITCLTLGIFISIKTETRQAAMLISLVGLLLPSLLFSGFMFPMENMPLVLQWISNIIPAKWFYIIIKSIMIKGLGFSAIYMETLALLTITLVLFVLSIKNFKVRVQ